MAEVFKLGIAANNNQPIKEVNSITVLANKGIEGDDTHGHIDDIARFVSENTIMTAVENNKKDMNLSLIHISEPTRP